MTTTFSGPRGQGATMKILVIDDRQENLDGAIAQLGGSHDVFTTASYDMGNMLISRGDSVENRKVANLTAGRSIGSYSSWSNKHYEDFSAGVPWDVVLSDGMMPFDGFYHNSDWGTEKLVGYQLALSAIAAGTRFVAVVFSNHHHQNAEGSILEESSRIRDSFRFANGAVLRFFQDAGRKAESKDWAAVLNKLIG